MGRTKKAVVMFQAIVDFFSFIVSKPWALVVSLIEWIANFVTVTIPAAIWAIVPEGLASYLSNLDFLEVTDIIQPITWFFPVWSITAIYSTAYGLAAAIRVVRFIIGWIPTVEG